MKIILVSLFLVNIIHASNEKTDNKIINLLEDVKHNKTHIMKKIARNWSSSQYKNDRGSRLDINIHGNFKSYLPYKLKNSDGKPIGSKGKYWVYSSIKKTCLVWKGVVEKNGIELNKHYPNICKNTNDEAIGAIVYGTNLSEKKLSNGFWSLAKFDLINNDILNFTNFQGKGKLYIQKEKPNQLKLEQEFRDSLYSNNINKMDEILKSGIIIDINKMFIIAVQVSNFSTIKFLLENDADVNYKNSHGNILSQASMKDSNLEKIKYIIENGGKYDKKSVGDQSPIYSSAQARQFKLINFWLNNGIDINIQKSNGRTPIFDVCWNRKNIFANVIYYDTLKLLKFMVQKGANPLIKDKRGITPLHLISEDGTAEHVKYISSFYDNINIQDNFLQTPLHYAARDIQYDNKEKLYGVIKYLLSQGANKNLKDKMNRTPYDIVKKMQFPDKKILELLK